MILPVLSFPSVPVVLVAGLVSTASDFSNDTRFLGRGLGEGVFLHLRVGFFGVTIVFTFNEDSMFSSVVLSGSLVSAISAQQKTQVKTKK